MIVIGIFGGHKIGKTAWKPDQKLTTVAVFGGVELDFRQAQLPGGGVTVRSWSLFGGTKFLVPRNVPVTLGGICVVGGKQDTRGSPDGNPQTDGLRITAVTLFGGLEVRD